MQERLILHYRQFSDEEIVQVVEGIKDKSFKTLGRTIPVEHVKVASWKWWIPKLLLTTVLVSSNRDGLLYQYHEEILNFFHTKVPIETWVGSTVIVEGKTTHTAESRMLS